MENAIGELSYFVRETMAKIKGDDVKALALKNERLAKAAIKNQINKIEFLIVELETKVDTAKEAFEDAIYPTVLITDPKAYADSIVKAKKDLKAAEETLEEAKKSLEFYSVEIQSKINKK